MMMIVSGMSLTVTTNLKVRSVMAHDYTYFYSATRKYFCLNCGVATRQRQCEKCGKKTQHTHNRTINTYAKGKNKAKKREQAAKRIRVNILNHKERGYWQWRRYVRSCGLHSSQSYKMVDANTMNCVICNKVVWRAKGLY